MWLKSESVYVRFCIRKLSIITPLTFVVLLILFQFIKSPGVKTFTPEQEEIDYISKYLCVKVIAKQGHTQLMFTNTGSKTIKYGPWSIYLYTLANPQTAIYSGLEFNRVNGGLFFLSPVKTKFETLQPEQNLILSVRGWKTAARTDHFPNWYVAGPDDGNSEPRILESTRGENLSFVLFESTEMAVVNSKKRFSSYNMTTAGSDKFKMLAVIPTPLEVKYVSNKVTEINKSWVVCEFIDDHGQSWSEYLAKALSIPEVKADSKFQNYFEFKRSSDLDPEAYLIAAQPENSKIVISSNTASGAFYATQTILSVLRDSANFPDVHIHDKPRFKHRGLMLDVVRNFHSKEELLKIIDMMAIYKMNKLHLHLTDDEGWRIEIPSIPELTRYGSQRCHYSERDRCLTPSLGSGPFRTQLGSSFYTVSDFQEILAHAKERHVQVIPEIDMPGHSRSAVLAILYREADKHQREDKGDQTESYLLGDSISRVASIQGWVGNAMNPCLNSTYHFISKILQSLKDTYQGIQPLDVVHIGGDEVPSGIWKDSMACETLFRGQNIKHSDLKEMFMKLTANLAYKLDLNLALWEDGILHEDKGPFKRADFKQNTVYVNSWNNIWEIQRADRPVKFANAGYSVIMSLATHLYLDHPYEADPEERGLRWATGYIDTYKVFGLLPMDIYANADVDRFGKIVDPSSLCQGPCPSLQKVQNIAGLEACVWSETIRTEEQLHNMLFPRFLAVAERSWHKANWESVRNKDRREAEKIRDWTHFVHVLGTKELQRLEDNGIHYRIPPPGMFFNEITRELHLKSLYSNHRIMVSFGTPHQWKFVSSSIQVPAGATTIYAKTVVPSTNRCSRIVYETVSSSTSSPNTICQCLVIVNILVMSSFFLTTRW